MYNETFNDTVLRLLPFIVLLLTLAGLEHLRPWRQSAQSLLPRWRNHFTLQLIAIGVVRGIFSHRSRNLEPARELGAVVMVALAATRHDPC